MTCLIKEWWRDTHGTYQDGTIVTWIPTLWGEEQNMVAPDSESSFGRGRDLCGEKWARAVTADPQLATCERCRWFYEHR